MFFKNAFKLLDKLENGLLKARRFIKEKLIQMSSTNFFSIFCMLGINKVIQDKSNMIADLNLEWE